MSIDDSLIYFAGLVLDAQALLRLAQCDVTVTSADDIGARMFLALFESLIEENLAGTVPLNMYTQNQAFSN
jgi:hypothetical protein